MPHMAHRVMSLNSINKRGNSFMRGTSINRRGEPPLLDKSESRKRRYSLNRRKSKAEFELELVDEVIHEAERTSTNQAALVQESLWDDPGEVIKALYDSVEGRSQRRRHYLALFCFVFYVFLYLTVLALQKDAGGQYLLTSSMSEDLVPRDVNELPRATFYKDTAIYDWLEGIMQKHWEELKCGDGVCTHPLEYRSFGRFGCQADCGAHNSTFVRFVLMANLKSDAALSEVTFNLCNREEQESPGKPLCWYKEDQRFQSVHETVAHNVLLPDGQWELRIRNIAGSNGGVIAGVSVAGDSLRAQPSADAQSPGPDAQPSSGDDPSNSHGRRILSILGDSQRLEQKRVHQLKHLLMAPDEHVGSVPGAVEARVLSEVDNFFDSAQGAVDGATHWTHWQYERHHVLEQYDLHQYVLWTYEECHDGVLQAMDMIRNSSLQCHLDWRPASCCAFLSDVLHHECSCTDQLELLEAVGVDTNAVETCATIEAIPLVSGKLCPITSPVEWTPTSIEEVNTVACHHIVHDLANSTLFEELCSGNPNTTSCCPMLHAFDKYNCECSDSFVKLQHTKQLKFERLFVDCNMDTQEHAHGRCDGHAVPVYIGSSPEFAKEYNAWLTEKAAVDFIHMEAQMILDEDWVQHSLSTRVLLGSEVSCPPVGDEPPDCDTHLRRLLSSCESKSEDHTVTCNSVCASYLCDEKVSLECAHTEIEWTSYTGDSSTRGYLQAWSSYKGVYEHQGCASCQEVNDECYKMALETKSHLLHCSQLPQSACFWSGEEGHKVSIAEMEIEEYFHDLGDDVICALAHGIQDKYGQIQNVTCDHMIEEFRTADELFNTKCRENHNSGYCEIHADCGLGQFCGLVETQYGASMCVDCVDCCDPPNGNGLFWGSEPGCGHCVCDECSPGCTLSMRTNSVCDQACFTETCAWDNFHCYNELASYEVECPHEPGHFWEPVLYHSTEVEYAMCCKMTDQFDSSVSFDLWNFRDESQHSAFDLVPDSTQVDSSQALKRFITSTNRVLVGLMLVLERFDKSSHCDAADEYRELYPHCLGHALKAPYGIDPIFQFGTSLYDETLKEHQSDHCEAHDINDAGVPFGFHHHKVAGFENHPGYPILFDINMLPGRTRDLLTYMKEGHFLGFESQRLTAQLLTFNGNVGMFANTVVTLDFLPHGGIKISHAVSSIVLELYLTGAHYGRAFLEMCFVACYLVTLHSLYMELRHSYKKTHSVLAYFTQDLFNAVECVSILLGLANILQWIDIVVASSSFSISERFDVYEDLQGEANWLKLANGGQGLRDAAQQFSDIKTLRLKWDYYMFFNAVNLVLMMIRVLKIMDFHPDIGMITRTLRKAAHDLANYCVVTSVIVTVYAFMGHIFFGDKIFAMSTMEKAYSTCLYFMIGEFLDSSTWTTNMNMFTSITVRIWFWSYVTVVFIVLLSALLAIIVSAMDELKNEDIHREKTNLFKETAHIIYFCVESLRQRYKRRMTESTVRKNMKVMLQAMYKENDCDRSTVYEPMVKAIQLGATIYTQEQLAKFLSYVAENYMDDSSLDQSFSRSPFADPTREREKAPMTPGGLKGQFTGEMAKVLFRSLAKPQADAAKDAIDEKQLQEEEIEQEGWKREVLSLLRRIDSKSAEPASPAHVHSGGIPNTHVVPHRLAANRSHLHNATTQSSRSGSGTVPGCTQSEDLELGSRVYSYELPPIVCRSSASKSLSVRLDDFSLHEEPSTLYLDNDGSTEEGG